MPRFGSKKARLVAGKEYETADTKNYEGVPSWSYTDEERLVMTLLTNVLEPTYYVTQEELTKEALVNHEKILEKDPDFYMRALAYGRTEGKMRLQPILGLVLLTSKDIYIPYALFEKVIRTPNDLASFIDLCRNAGIRKGLGQKVKTLINQWLAKKLSEYWYIKYKDPVVQAIKLAHPKMTSVWNRPVAMAYKAVQKQVIKITSTGQEEMDVETDAVAEPVGTVKDLVDYAMIMEDDERDLDEELLNKLPKIKVYHELKSKVYSQEEVTIEEIKYAIHEARLPHEAITGVVKPTSDLWREIMYQMPYFALLRHIVTLHKNKVFEDPESLLYVCEKLSNLEAVQRSDILPYRFYRTYEIVKQSGVPSAIHDALNLALERSFDNFPVLEDDGCIAIDVSGSMTYYPNKNPQRPYSNVPERKGDIRFIEIAGTFGVPLMKKAPDAIVLPFDMAGRYGYQTTSTRGIYPNLLDRSASLLENIDKLASRRGGGTDMSLPVRHLIDNDIKVDWFIGITDCEEWGARSRVGDGVGWLTAWKNYKETIAPEALAFIITVSPYGHSVYPFNESGVFQIFGWSDQVLKFIQLGLSGLDTQVDYVRKFPYEAEVIEI